MELLRTGKGNKIAVKPSTSAMFEMFDPTTFPIEISGLPERAASKLTKSSGADVPKDTTVTPTTKVEILKCDARATPPFTSKSPLYNRIINPSNK
jgi:hypothetical protein